MCHCVSDKNVAVVRTLVVLWFDLVQKNNYKSLVGLMEISDYQYEYLGILVLTQTLPVPVQ